MATTLRSRGNLYSVEFTDEERVRLPRPHLKHSVAPLLIEFDLVFLFDTQAAYHSDSVVIE